MAANDAPFKNGTCFKTKGTSSKRADLEVTEVRKENCPFGILIQTVSARCASTAMLFELLQVECL
jgi:hypothetical protein